MIVKGGISTGLFLLFTLLHPIECIGQKEGVGIHKEVYKTIDDTTELAVYFTYPSQFHSRSKWPLIVFFHGGGWNQGSYRHFLRQARYFSEKGYISALPEYRIKQRHGATPFKSLKDAKSVIRFLKGNSGEFGIDTTRIVAAGGSAGGHLAAALELVDSYNDSTDNLDISTKVDALVLFNPVLDNGPDGYGYARIGEEYLSFSPFHQEKKGTAPTLVLLGTEDNILPVKKAQSFCSQMHSEGSVCELVLYENQEHGFFNRSPFYEKTRNEMDSFLESIIPTN